jgi:hypothetical protein
VIGAALLDFQRHDGVTPLRASVDDGGVIGV